MFQGVVHANARKVIASYVPFLPERVHVICSGNFSIETTLRMNGFAGHLTGCDVSLYTCSLGAYLAGLDIPVQVNAEDYPEFADQFNEHIGDQQGRVACIAIALDMLEFRKQNNRYQQRMYSAYLRKIPELVEKTRARLEKKKEQVCLGGFFPQDGWERAGDIPVGEQDAVLTFPPTYSQGYEKLYAKLHEAFVWEQPEYVELTSGSEFARRITERGGPWIIGAEIPDTELENLTGPPVAVTPRGSDVSVYLYSNIEQLDGKVIRRHINTEEPEWPRLTDKDKITPKSRLEVHRIKSNEANYIRQVYVSAEVAQSSAQYSYAVSVGGKLAGLVLFQATTTGGKNSLATRRA